MFSFAIYTLLGNRMIFGVSGTSEAQQLAANPRTESAIDILRYFTYVFLASD